MSLKLLNPHQRDALLLFNEDAHKYHIGDIQYTSVTTFISTVLFEPFDEDLVSKIIAEKEKSQEDKYYGLNEIEIKNKWKETRDLGIGLHKTIENYYNNIQNTDSITFYNECQLFWQFEKEIINTEFLIPYRTEWQIYDNELKMAGTIDMCYKTKDNQYIIYDWKRIEKLTTSNCFKSGIIDATKNTPDCNLVHYEIQLMLYKYILETNYGIKVSKMFLLLLHPSNESYIRHEIITYEPLLNNIIMYRKQNQ